MPDQQPLSPMESDGSYCRGQSSRWQKRKYDFYLVSLHRGRAALCLGRARMDKPFGEKMIPGKLATFFSRRMLEVSVARYGKRKPLYTEVIHGERSGGVCTGPGGEGAAVRRARPAKRASCVHAPQLVTPATRKHTSMHHLQPGRPRRLRINDRAEQNVNL